jgi:methionyl-tRNA synthetase
MGSSFPFTITIANSDTHKFTNLIQKELDSKGYIYKDSYAGWYAVSDEAYHTEAQVMAIIDEKTGEQIMVRIIPRKYNLS